MVPEIYEVKNHLAHKPQKPQHRNSPAKTMPRLFPVFLNQHQQSTYFRTPTDAFCMTQQEGSGK